MRIFAWTCLGRIVLLLAARVYMVNFQSDKLYSFLNLTNPATQSLDSINKRLDSFGSGFSDQLSGIDARLELLDQALIQQSGSVAPNSPSSSTPTTGADAKTETGDKITLEID